MKNQCDGCRRGLPVEDGIHRSGNTRDLMFCTKDRYVSYEDTVAAIRATVSAYCAQYEELDPQVALRKVEARVGELGEDEEDLVCEFWRAWKDYKGGS